MTEPKETKSGDKIREQPMTYNDYANLPDDGMRYELADGVLEAMSPSPTAKHQLISQQVEHKLMGTCFSNYVIFLAPMDVILSDKEVRQPDIIMLHRDRLSLVTKRGIEGPPDLVVEVLSAHSIKRDKQTKLKSYARHGIEEYWIIDISNEALEQYVLNNSMYVLSEIFLGDELVRSERIPCASFTMNEIISSLPEFPNF
jgi:Uma2 family endonuclease